MTINNFPAALQPIIQQNYLEREFTEALESQLGYRKIADREFFPQNIGETLTKTRRGLKAPATNALAPSTNTNLDNGLTPSTWTVEQYTITLNMYADSIDLNTVTNKVGIVDQFMQNIRVNAVQAAQTLDRLARATIFNAAFSGNTRVRVTLGAAGPAVAVDDIRGFLLAPVNGSQQPISVSNTLAVTVGADVYTLIGATADVTNVSVAPGGISGVLTFSSNVSTADATVNNTVQAANASVIIRPNQRANTSLLTGTDLLTMASLLDAVASLRANSVPPIEGYYNAYLDPVSARQLFADPDFKQLFQGATSGNSVFAGGMVNDFLGLRMMPTTEAYIQQASGYKIRRPLVCGQGALIEGDFASIGDSDEIPANSLVHVVDSIALVTREPIDRLQQIIAQSWYWIGGFTAPSDITTNSTIIPTASNAAYKRAVMIEHVG